MECTQNQILQQLPENTSDAELDVVLVVQSLDRSCAACLTDVNGKIFPRAFLLIDPDKKRMISTWAETYRAVIQWRSSVLWARSLKIGLWIIGKKADDDDAMDAEEKKDVEEDSETMIESTSASERSSSSSLLDEEVNGSAIDSQYLPRSEERRVGKEC